ncbi:MAG: UDP-N-acetylmuramate dehydrogenase [Candidatus Didemnitutus sp.]|nr:UDP-N-acetylmuramate dehydrogenase [Candidatus Didemnitutus sp.]
MNLPPPVFGRAVQRVHLLGAGGMGMTPLALYLRARGFAVSADDDAWNPATRAWLERADVTVVAPGELPADAELVVFSPAVAATHPLRQRATERGLPQVRRGEMLAEVTRDRRLVAVVGSHGKTTTTAMLVTALVRARFECGWVLGGLFGGDALPPARDAGEWVIVEVDESDGTIGCFAPEVTLAVNLDWDHADHYATRGAIEDEFAALFARTRGSVLVNAACAMSQRVVARLANPARVESPARAPRFLRFVGPTTCSLIDYKFSEDGQYVCSLIDYKQDGCLGLTLGGDFALQKAEVRARGEFNALNATAALAAAQVIGAAIASDALADFAGVRRRQGVLHASPRLTVIEDYAHHPAEIRALLAALRPGAARLLVVFQPHRFTRTAQFKAEFAQVLSAADEIFLLEVYAASEAPVAGGTTDDLAAEFARLDPPRKVARLPRTGVTDVKKLAAALRDGDLLAFVGAGDIEVFAQDFLKMLQPIEEREAAWRRLVADVRPLLSDTTKFTEREPLGPKTTMRVGGPARVYAEPATEQELQLLLATAHARGLPVFMLGRGSNLLVPDEGVDGLVISLGHPNWQVFTPRVDGSVWVGAGLRLKNLCGLATKAGLGGFEFMEGIPATVGGALRMNAGAMGGWTFDVVEEVHLLTLAGEKRVMRKSEMHVDYRHCEELETAVALGAVLRPRAGGDAAAIKQQIETYQKKRQESQPREPSAGCIFKNPPGTSAGKLIDECGLKGERVGDAMVSPVHANFIVNTGAASAADILELVRRVRARVREVRGVDLQPEVMLFGADWRDVL